MRITTSSASTPSASRCTSSTSGQQCYTTYRQVWQDYQVPYRWCTYHPVYQQHVRQECYTVQRPVWTTYQVPHHWCTYHPVYQQHVRTGVLHG